MRRIWDVTLPLMPGMPVWPGDPAVEVQPISEIRRGDPCNISHYSFGSHTGTHLDPPFHYSDEGAALHDLPLDLFLGSCVVADFTRVSEAVTAADLEAASLPSNTERLLLKTANSRLWENPCHSFRPEFVELSVDGAEWAIAHGIRLIGIDYLSIERPEHEDSPVHRSLSSTSVVILEGLDLRAVPAGEYELICLPLKTMNGDGAPARVLLIGESSEPSSD